MQELIDTLWNVNKKSEAEKKRQVKELIDTLWNVNQKVALKEYNALVKELIDTLWNVNSSVCQIPVWQMVN